MFFYSLAVAALHLAYVSPTLMGMDLMATGSHGEYELGGQFVFWLLFLPLLILTSILVFFKQKLSKTKHLISIVYLSSAFFMVTIVVQDAIEYVFPEAIEGISFLLAIALNTFLSLLVFFILAAALFGILYMIIPIQIN